MKSIIGAVVKKARVREGTRGIDLAPNAFILKALSADGEKQPRTVRWVVSSSAGGGIPSLTQATARRLSSHGSLLSLFLKETPCAGAHHPSMKMCG